MHNPLLPLAAENAAQVEKEAAALQRCQQPGAPKGVTITRPQALALATARQKALANSGRVEFEGGSAETMLSSFASSLYLPADNWPEVLEQLYETFYHFKNELGALITDEELLQFMRTAFDERCHGSLDLLQGRELETLCAQLRGLYEPDEDNTEPVEE